MSRKIVVTSGKGGVGKTTFVSFLGHSLAQMGYKVLLVDMDFGLNNLDVLLGVENKIVYDIIDILEGKCLPKQALIEDFFYENLFILPSTHGFCSKKFGAKELLKIIAVLEKDFQYIIIDCPAGLDGGFSRAIACGGEFIVVTTPHLSAIRDAGKVINKLNEISKIKPFLVVNRARGDLILDGDMISIDEIKNCLFADLIGVIPEDDDISRQLLFGGILDQLSISKVSIDMISYNIVYGDHKIYDCLKKYRGLLGGIKKKLRKRV